ncbi:hypothetical protein [Vacuolonema iberomarrocanum]|uniref:hypothetical protein n=1 Tax=Vacuolonema iberomarrocanum TaxID=3454632 RepID=UPI001A10031E|nr:hypothetical protein [filamentous cyanobacterium LEGE 07170]
MNAAEKANGLENATKIAAIVNLFKTQFPDARADLKPWANDPDTRELVDPDSIDIGFHLPGWSPKFQSRSILVQIRFFEDPAAQTHNVIGVEAVGFSHNGEQWRLSTIDQWQFRGAAQPRSPIQAQLKDFCRQVYELFSPSQGEDEK